MTTEGTPDGPTGARPAGPQGGCDGQAPARVVEVGRLELAVQGGPPAADGVRPEDPATECGGKADGPPEEPPGRAGGSRVSRALINGAAAGRAADARPWTGGPVPAELPALPRLALGQAIRRDGGDLDQIAGLTSVRAIRKPRE